MLTEAYNLPAKKVTHIVGANHIIGLSHLTFRKRKAA